MANLFVDAALEYADRGWAVFPVHTIRDGRCSCGQPACDSPAKHPRTRTGLKEATTDPDTIRGWWRRWPDSNIALVTGEQSGIVVLDVDGPAGESTLAAHEAIHGHLPATLQAITGGDGMHYLFRHPGERIRNSASKKLGQGLDVRGDGGYIVAAPSVHRTGQTYLWVDLHTDLADMPAWMFDLVRERKRTTPPAAPPAAVLATEGGTPYGLEALGRELDALRTAGEGSRNHQLNSSAFSLGQLVAGGELDERVTVDHLASTARAIGLTEHEIPATIASGLERGKTEPRRGRTPPPQPARSDRNGNGNRPEEHGDQVEDPKPPMHHTDLGNARRLVAAHGAELRFCHDLNRWLIWDGRRWRRDNTGEVYRRAKQVIGGMYTDALRLPEEARKKLVKHALESEGQRRIEAMVKAATTEPGISVAIDELDADPWLLNCLNGTVDLRTGQLRPHDQNDLITKIAPVDHDPDATLDIWDNFLVDATGADADLERFMARAAGYSLTGLTTEEVLFFVHGPAASGKSTFLEALKATLGDYADTADFETFLARNNTNSGPRDDIANLAGARFVVSIEVDEGKRLAEGLVKTITGGDTIRARRLYENSFAFRPAFKLWLAANSAPRVRHDDEAMWRRILRLPFEHIVAKGQRDPKIKATLRNPVKAGPAILAWAIKGCQDWQRNGLGVPSSVVAATEAYRADMDPIGDFIADTCTIDTDMWVETGRLFAAYRHWATEAGINTKYQLTRKSFANHLSQHGCTPDRRRIGGTTKRVWDGIGLSDVSVQPSLDGSEPSRDGSVATSVAGDHYQLDQELFDEPDPPATDGRIDPPSFSGAHARTHTGEDFPARRIKPSEPSRPDPQPGPPEDPPTADQHPTGNDPDDSEGQWEF